MEGPVWAYETRSRVDEWGNLFVDVVLADVVIYTYDTKQPRPITRMGVDGAHAEAITAFARRQAFVIQEAGLS